MTISEKQDALNNELTKCNINPKYFISSINIDHKIGLHKFAICYKNEYGDYVNVTDFYEYSQMNTYIKAYGDGLNNKLQ